MSFCKLGNYYHNTNNIFAIDLASPKCQLFSYDAVNGQAGPLTPEDKIRIRKVFLADERFYAMGDLILRVEKVMVISSIEVKFQVDKLFSKTGNKWFSITPIPNFDNEAEKFFAHLEEKKKEKEKEMDQKTLLQYVMSIDKKLDDLGFAPGGPIAEEAAKSFAGHREERQILKEKEPES
jgi:hypothetical protein